MDAPEDDDLFTEVADAIADGRPVDWAALEQRWGHRGPGLLAELKVLAGLAGVHRQDYSQEADGGTPAPPESDATSWGAFTNLRPLGDGTFGVVYRAYEGRLDRDVALKLLHRRVAAAGASSAVAEGRLLARITHPNVITVHGADVIDGTVGIWMELLAGQTLQAELEQRGPFGAREAALIGIDLCHALSAVHKVGLVHRDVKAQNVMRQEGGRIVLMDFGAGTDVAAEGGSIGTPLYMAPEVLAEAAATPASDLYALGVLLFKLVTGEFPVVGETLDALKAAHARGERRRLRALRPDLPTSFVQAVERALESDPVQRPATAADLERLLEQTLVSPAAAAPANTPRPSGRGRLWLGIAAALAVATAAAAVALRPYWSNPSPPATIRSIAVLPFTRLGSGADQELLADSMTQLLIDNLARFRSLRVTSRTTAMTYRDRKQPLAGIANELNVDAVVEGAVGRHGDRLLVNVRLLRGNEEQIWGQNYERPAGDLFKVQGEIAAFIADAINLSTTSAELADVSAAPVRSQAQDAYLRGTQRLYDARDDSLRAAFADLLDAVRLDPSSARAWATLSQCYISLANRELMPQDAAYAEALKAAERAQLLDESVAEGHTQMAEVKFYYEWNWAVARREYERALQLNPNNSRAMARYSMFLSALGLFDDAVRFGTQARDLDPANTTVRVAPGMAFLYARRYDKAIEEFRGLAELPPYTLLDNDRFGLGRAYGLAGDFPTAVAEMERVMARAGRRSAYLSELARLRAQAGQIAEARALFRELAQKPDSSPAFLAFVHIALGEADQAFEQLDRAADRRSPSLLWLKVDSRFDPIRADPRFRELVQRVGIPH